MRIVHVTDAYLPHLGGIETHVSGLAAHQGRAGHEVHVLTRARGTAGSGPDGPLVHRAGRAALGEVLRAGRFDVVHVHVSVFSPMAMSLTAAACAHGLPVAVTAHSMWPHSPALVQPAGTGLRLARRPVAWSAVSQVAAGPLRRALGTGVLVDVVPNAVDVAWWRARSDRVLSSPYAGEVVVTSLGRLAARKRPLALLRALRTVRELVEPEVRLRLVLAGEGRQLPRLRRAVAAWGMTDWVDLPGRLSREQSRELLQRSDVYVAPADLESFGIAALEARTVGLPVVAKACSGVAEYVGHGTEGLLVGSDHEMALAVAALVRDPALRTRIAAHNAAVPPATTWPFAVERTEQLYRRAADLAGRQHPVLSMEAAS